MQTQIIKSSNVANLLETARLSPSNIQCLAFSPNASVLAIGNDNNVELWRTDDGFLLGTLPAGPTAGVVFHPTGKALVAVNGNQTQTFSLWDATTMTRIKAVTVPVGHQPQCIAITPTGQTMALGDMNGPVHFWSWNNGNPILRSTLAAHSGYVTSVAFSPDGLYLASGAQDGVRLWHIGFDLIPQLRSEILIPANNGIFNQLSFNGSGTMLVAPNQSSDKLYVMHGSDGTIVELSEPLSNGGEMLDGAFAATEQLIVSVQGYSPTGDTHLQFWDVSTRTLLLTKILTCERIKFSPDGQVLVVLLFDPIRGKDTPTIWRVLFGSPHKDDTFISKVLERRH